MDLSAFTFPGADNPRYGMSKDKWNAFLAALTADSAALVARIAALESVVVVDVPTGFDWTPPISIYRVGGAFVTNFDADDYKVPATATYYVSTTGSNTTGDGTAGNPWATPAKAMADGAGTNITIFIEAGEYELNSIGAVPDKSVNFIANGGRVLITNKWRRTGWAADGGAYKAALSGFNAGGGVRDAKFPTTWPNGETTPQMLAPAANVAGCQATASSYYTDGTDVWVHLQDGRKPDADYGEDVGVIHQGTMVTITSADRQYYFEGIDFEGGSFIVQPGVDESVARIVLNDCTYRFNRGSSGVFTITGTDLAILNRVRVYDSEHDAFGYAPIALNQPDTNAIEIDCHAYKVGLSGTTENCSTNHADGRTVRINCVYRDSFGPVVADVGTVQSWHLGVDAQDSLMTSNDKQDACLVCGNDTLESVEHWYDDCTTGGSFYDIFCGEGSTVKIRNMSMPASTGGLGTITTY